MSPRCLDKSSQRGRPAANRIAFLSSLTHMLWQQDPPRLGRCFGNALRTPAGFLFFGRHLRHLSSCVRAA